MAIEPGSCRRMRSASCARPVGARLQRMACIAQQVAEDLDQLVTIERQRRQRLVFAPDGDVGHVREVDGDGVVEQLGDVDRPR